MKSWKEENLLNEAQIWNNDPLIARAIDKVTSGFTTKRNIKGYTPTAEDRQKMKSDVAKLAKILYRMCDIAGGKGSAEYRKDLGSVDDARFEFENALKKFYDEIDYMMTREE